MEAATICLMGDGGSWGPREFLNGRSVDIRAGLRKLKTQNPRNLQASLNSSSLAFSTYTDQELQPETLRLMIRLRLLRIPSCVLMDEVKQIKSALYSLAKIFSESKIVEYSIQENATGPGKVEVLIDSKQHYKLFGKDLDATSLIKLNIQEGKVVRHEGW